MDYSQDFINLIDNNEKTNVIRNVYQKYKNNIDIHYENDEAFRYACGNGNLELCKWLLTLDTPESFNIHIYDDWSFGLSCETGNLELCKWLYSLDTPDTFNIHYYNNYVFRDACRSGKLELCKWLYSLDTLESFNIHYYNNYALRLCKDIFVKFWILSLDKPENFYNDSDEFKKYYPLYLKYISNKNETLTNLKNNRVFNRFTLMSIQKYLM